MPRWEAHARERLTGAALDLFAEQGYDGTTVTEIAARAGLTRSTFFRHFADKREVLFGEDAMSALLADAIAAAPRQATPWDAVAAAVEAAGHTVFTVERHSFVARRQSVISANPELQEREALKGLALTTAMARALQRRDVPAMTARVAADLGALVLGTAMDRWTRSTGVPAFDELARQVLDEVRATARSLTEVGRTA